MTDPTPETHRMLHTRDGVVGIPRDQKGTPVADYFANADLPDDMARAVVYDTPKGPVVGKADPVPWNEQHTAKAREYAGQIKEQIEEKGYYAKTMNVFAGRLAEQTGRSPDEVKAVIVQAFEHEHGKDPFTYLQDQRQNKGLPTREARQPGYEPDRS